MKLFVKFIKALPDSIMLFWDKFNLDYNIFKNKYVGHIFFATIYSYISIYLFYDFKADFVNFRQARSV
jgi:hypothetical protein